MRAVVCVDLQGEAISHSAGLEGQGVFMAYGYGLLPSTAQGSCWEVPPGKRARGQEKGSPGPTVTSLQPCRP